MITIYQILMILFAVSSIFLGFIIMLSKQKTVRDHETIKALWGKTKEIEIRLEDLRHDLSKNYSTKTDAREFIELTQKSIFDKLEGLEKLIAKITNSLEK